MDNRDKKLDEITSELKKTRLAMGVGIGVLAFGAALAPLVNRGCQLYRMEQELDIIDRELNPLKYSSFSVPGMKSTTLEGLVKELSEESGKTKAFEYIWNRRGNSRSCRYCLNSRKIIGEIMDTKLKVNAIGKVKAGLLSTCLIFGSGVALSASEPTPTARPVNEKGQTVIGKKKTVTVSAVDGTEHTQITPRTGTNKSPVRRTEKLSTTERVPALPGEVTTDEVYVYASPEPPEVLEMDDYKIIYTNDYREKLEDEATIRRWRSDSVKSSAEAERRQIDINKHRNATSKVYTPDLFVFDFYQASAERLIKREDEQLAKILNGKGITYRIPVRKKEDIQVPRYAIGRDPEIESMLTYIELSNTHISISQSMQIEFKGDDVEARALLNEMGKLELFNNRVAKARQLANKRTTPFNNPVTVEFYEYKKTHPEIEVLIKNEATQFKKERKNTFENDYFAKRRQSASMQSNQPEPANGKPRVVTKSPAGTTVVGVKEQAENTR